MKSTWFVVLNSDLVVLGVWGSALSDLADEQVSKVQQQFPSVGCSKRLVSTVKRPRVGSTLSRSSK